MNRTLPIRAALVAVGTELLADGRPDTNGTAISRLLAARGVATGLRVQVPDEEEPIARVLSEAAPHFPVIIVTGGLGPTVDDVTRQALARAFGLGLAEDPEALEQIEARLRSRGREITPASRRQALVPHGAETLANPAGTAPGVFLAAPGGAWIFLLPGVPHEMLRMMVEQVLPRLSAAAGPPLAWKGLKAAGLTEVQVQEKVLDLMDSSPSASLTLLASPMEISLIFRAADPREADRLARRAAERLGDAVFSEELETGLEQAAGRLLKRRGLTLATAESCTGGLLGSLVTRVPGSSGWYLQGWITYSNESKTSSLGVPAGIWQRDGAVSEATAEAMAVAARSLSGASHALSISGIAGPDGGTPDRPVGLVYIGLATGAGCAVTRHLFPGDRETIRLFAARAALNRLRLALTAEEGTP
jgi:nicotinamide-nucleotide amidase